MSNESALDALKARAKQLLTAAHAGDSVVIDGLREALPKLSQLSVTEFAAQVKLADVHHALARKRGHESWGALKRALEQLDPIQLQAERFLEALQNHDTARAEALLASTPLLARYNAQCAAAACDASTLETLLTSDAALATRSAGGDGREPIIYACGTPLAHTSAERMRQNTRCVELLLAHGASANASMPFGDEGTRLPVLYFASAINNIGAVKLLLAHGANPNDGESIYHSAEHNFREVMQLLVDAGCNLSGRDAGWDNTPLYFLAGHKPSSALCASSERGMEWLLEHGADPNVPTYISEKHAGQAQSGERPLHRVAEFGKGVRIASALIAHGADVNAMRNDGKTAYVLAVRTGNTPVANLLVEHGADTNVLSSVDRLVGACAIADEATARRIVHDDPAVIARLTDADKWALCLAAEEGRDASVRLMVSLGWSLTHEGDWGGTALHHAAWQGRAAATRTLIELGAPIDFRDKQFGSSPIGWAAHGSRNGRPGHDEDYADTVSALLDAGSSREPSYNRWGEPPENLASKAVVRLLRERKFAP